MYDIMELSNKSLEELYSIAENLNVKRVKSYSKDELVYKILDEQAIQGVNVPIQKKQRNRIVSPKSVRVERPVQNNMEAAPAPAAQEKIQETIQEKTQEVQQNTEKQKRQRQRIAKQHTAEPAATAEEAVAETEVPENPQMP